MICTSESWGELPKSGSCNPHRMSPFIKKGNFSRLPTVPQGVHVLLFHE